MFICVHTYIFIYEHMCTHFYVYVYACMYACACDFFCVHDLSIRLGGECRAWCRLARTALLPFWQGRGNVGHFPFCSFHYSLHIKFKSMLSEFPAFLPPWQIGCGVSNCMDSAWVERAESMLVAQVWTDLELLLTLIELCMSWIWARKRGRRVLMCRCKRTHVTLFWPLVITKIDTCRSVEPWLPSRLVLVRRH